MTPPLAPSPAAAPPASPRSQLAELQRAQMRRRLIESAILVFAEQGASAVVIRDVIAMAGVARGSFYNHFRSTEELADAAAIEIAGEIMREVERHAGIEVSAAETLQVGVGLMLEIGRRHPLLGRFAAMLSLQASSQLTDLSQLLPALLAQGIAAGQFRLDDPQASTDLVIGTVRQASQRLAHHPMPPADPACYIRAVVAQILCGLGLPPAEAGRIAARPLPDIALPADSLLVRAEALQRQALAATKTTDTAPALPLQKA